MKFLHLLSNEASQSITLHCLNNAALSFVGTTHREKSRICFHGWNKQTFEKGTPLEPHVLQDECKIQDGSWHQSRFIFHTQESQQLPIVDIQEVPASQLDRQQHMEIGPVCFL
uniref:Fibrillar collagen NC1 domain-containing protein n=2 Tax=Oryzias melastigma TaxID=30732 RepID=A0A3B3DBU8_ORYME